MEDIRGDLKKYYKQDIAMEYLNLALREYVSGTNFIAVINLASAAEEMLGKIVSFKKKESALTRAKKWMRSWFAIQGINTPPDKELNMHLLSVKNGIKHINNDKDLIIEFDIEREAKEAIRRALENFNQIPELKQSAEILAYYQHEKT